MRLPKVGTFAYRLSRGLDRGIDVAKGRVAGGAPEVERPDPRIARAQPDREVDGNDGLRVPLEPDQRHSPEHACERGVRIARHRALDGGQREVAFSRDKQRSAERQMAERVLVVEVDRMPAWGDRGAGCRLAVASPAIDRVAGQREAISGVACGEGGIAGAQRVEQGCCALVVLLGQAKQQGKALWYCAQASSPAAATPRERWASASRTSKSMAATIWVVTSSWISKISVSARS